MRTRPLLVLGPLAAAIGCGGLRHTYPGPERPAAELAILRDTPEATVWAMDGTRVAGFGNTLAVLPGHHDVFLRVRLHTDTFNMQWTIWTYCSVKLQAEAGREYLSRVEKRTKRMPGLADRVDLEIGIAEVGGTRLALAHRCSGERPALEPSGPG